MGHLFASRLKELRTEWGLHQRDVEEALMLRPGVVSQYERGTREPSFDMLLAVADMFDVSADYLLGRPGAQRPSPNLAEARRRLQVRLRGRAADDLPLADLLALAAEAAPDHFTPARLARWGGAPEPAVRAHLGVGPEPPPAKSGRVAAKRSATRRIYATSSRR